MLSSILAILAIIAILAVGLFLSIAFVIALGRLRNRGSYQRIDAESERYRLRLGAPQFDAVASLLKCELPESIIRLHTSAEEVTRRDFEIVRPSGSHPIFISHYLPCDPKAVSDCYSDCKDLLTFASGGGDLTYAVDPKLGNNPPVLEFDAETGRFETVAEALNEFMAWPRRTAVIEDS